MANENVRVLEKAGILFFALAGFFYLLDWAWHIELFWLGIICEVIAFIASFSAIMEDSSDN